VGELFRKSDDSFLAADDLLRGVDGSFRGTDAPFPATGNSFASTNDSFQAADGSFPGADDPRSYKNGEFSLKSQKLEVEKLTTKTKRTSFTTKTKRALFTTKMKRARRNKVRRKKIKNFMTFVSFVVNLTGQEKSIIHHEEYEEHEKKVKTKKLHDLRVLRGEPYMKRILLTTKMKRARKFGKRYSNNCLLSLTS